MTEAASGNPDRICVSKTSLLPSIFIVALRGFCTLKVEQQFGTFEEMTFDWLTSSWDGTNDAIPLRQNSPKADNSIEQMTNILSIAALMKSATSLQGV